MPRPGSSAHGRSCPASTDHFHPRPRIRLLSQTAAARIRQFGIRFPNELHAVLAARKSAFTLAAGFFLVPLAMPCETAFSTAPLLTPFFTAFRTAFSIFLTALVCFLAIVHSLRSEDDLQLGIVHGQDAVNGAPGQAYSTKLPKMRLCDRSIAPALDLRDSFDSTRVLVGWSSLPMAGLFCSGGLE